ncbi:MAG TPA: hypothetical protein VGD84_20215 [Pseudonocardiaceae bacterium]
MDGDAAEAAQHTGVVHTLRAALGVTGDQGALAGTGAVHPMQRARHPQARLIETNHLGLGQAVGDLIKELPQPLGGPPGHGRNGAFGHRRAEQFGRRTPLSTGEVSGFICVNAPP